MFRPVPSSSSTIGRASPLPAEARRRAIIDAVLPLLIERGSRVTTKELASAAAVSEGTLFNVFDDKEALIAASVQAAMDQAPFEQAIAAIDADRPFERQLIEATEVIQRRTVDLWKLISQLPPHQHPNRRPSQLPSSPALAALFDKEIDSLRQPPAEAARLLRALTLALTHPMMVPEPHTPRDIVDVFLNGVSR
jgi:AcrR family transcriptional regulator